MIVFDDYELTENELVKTIETELNGEQLFFEMDVSLLSVGQCYGRISDGLPVLEQEASKTSRLGVD